MRSDARKRLTETDPHNDWGDWLKNSHSPRYSEEETRKALALAWEQGRAAERRDWELTFDITTPDEDRQPWVNPYGEA